MFRRLKMCNPEGFLSLPHKHKQFEPLSFFYSKWLCVFNFQWFQSVCSGWLWNIAIVMFVLEANCWKMSSDVLRQLIWASRLLQRKKAHNVHCRLVRYWYRFANSVQYKCLQKKFKIPSLFVFGRVWCVCVRVSCRVKKKERGREALHFAYSEIVLEMPVM